MKWVNNKTTENKSMDWFLYNRDHRHERVKKEDLTENLIFKVANGVVEWVFQIILYKEKSTFYFKNFPDLWWIAIVNIKFFSNLKAMTYCRNNQNKHQLGWMAEPFQDGGCCHIETSPLICGANQWTSFYMITACILKGLSTDLWDYSGGF